MSSSEVSITEVSAPNLEVVAENVEEADFSSSAPRNRSRSLLDVKSVSRPRRTSLTSLRPAATSLTLSPEDTGEVETARSSLSTLSFRSDREKFLLLDALGRQRRGQSSVKKALEGIAGDILKKRRNTGSSIRVLLSRKESDPPSGATSPLSRSSRGSTELAAGQVKVKQELSGSPISSRSMSRSPSQSSRRSKSGADASGQHALAKQLSSIASGTSVRLDAALSCAASDLSALNGNASQQSEESKRQAAWLRKRLAVLHALLAERQALHTDLEDMLKAFEHPPSTPDDARIQPACNGAAVEKSGATLKQDYVVIAGREESRLPRGCRVSLFGQVNAKGRRQFMSGCRASTVVHLPPSAADMRAEESAGDLSPIDPAASPSPRASVPCRYRSVTDEDDKCRSRRLKRVISYHGGLTAKGILKHASTARGILKHASTVSLPTFGHCAGPSLTPASSGGSYPGSTSLHLFLGPEPAKPDSASPTILGKGDGGSLWSAINVYSDRKAILSNLPSSTYLYPLIGTLPVSALEVSAPCGDSTAVGKMSDDSSETEP